MFTGQKSFRQKSKLQWIYIGNSKEIAHKTSGDTAASWTYYTSFFSDRIQNIRQQKQMSSLANTPDSFKFVIKAVLMGSITTTFTVHCKLCLKFQQFI